MLTNIVAPVCYALLFLAVVSRWKFFHLDGIKKSWVSMSFVLKLLAGVLFWAVYTFYYSDNSESDAMRYFDDSMTIHRQWFENRDVFWSFMLGRSMDDPHYAKVYDHLIAWTSAYRYGLSNDCSTIIRINVLISFISFGSFHVHAFFMSFMSFLGMTALFKAFHSIFIGKEKWLFVACFLLPSVVFWSSSLLKEAPLFMCLGFLFWSVSEILKRNNSIVFWLVLICSFVFLIYIKGYVIITLMPALIFLLLVRFTGNTWLIAKFISIHVLCFVVAQNAHHFFRGGDFIYVLHKKQIDFYNVAYLTGAGSVIDIPPITTPIAFFSHYPQAFCLTYFRPFLFEVSNPVYFLFALENAFYLMLVIMAILFYKKPERRNAPLLLASLSFVLVLATVIGSCVPILGAIIRYKVPALPLLVIFCFALINQEKVSKLRTRFFGNAVLRSNAKALQAEQ